ncbi:hypothetical protein CEG14_11055 [Bordetella genomosp. 1]|uniref:Uncharacterized protein n=1 Tax=Bordetella genomosp. 1 TaxID=1395607 RepID=A0A261SEV0_9BORD|nr:hypothetical protein [Bordetella genomosp. 1]OZI35601.1 hypothetical protein CEG14_11055 [Bordetella genomosp. 1]
MIITVQHRFKWLAYQTGQLVLAVALLSLVFNYGYRYTVDRNIDTPAFYAITVLLGLLVFVAWRRDYIFVKQYEFTPAAITVRTALGVTKTFPTTDYAFVPSLHKAVNVPEQKATLSFNVRDLRCKRTVRNYSWIGFSTEDFHKVSKLYGYAGEVDFKQGDLGKR